MSAFADQVNDVPVVLPPLKVCNIQFRRLFPWQLASQEDRMSGASVSSELNTWRCWSADGLN